jgi:hypothetical protein
MGSCCVSGENSKGEAGKVALWGEGVDSSESGLGVAVSSIGPFKGGSTSKVEEVLNVSSRGE